MSSILDWGDVAHSRLTRTIRWGDDLVAELQHCSNGSVPDRTVGEIEDWSESAAFFINFLLDGHSAKQLETLGYDPRHQVPVDRLSDYSAPRLRSEMLMRVTLLKKWFDEFTSGLTATEGLHHQILAILAEQPESKPLGRTSLQLRLRVETRPLVDALEYLQGQRLLEFNSTEGLIRLTASGKNRAKTIVQRSSGMSQYRPHDLIFFCYAREDFDTVQKIHNLVNDDGFNTWWDHVNLMPGQDWDHEIASAIELAAICLVFLSTNSVEKTGYVNKEIKRILDKMDMMPEGKVFLMPLRLDDCLVPRRLSKWQVLDYCQADWQKRLIAGLRHAL